MTTPMPSASSLDVQVVPMRDAHDDEIPAAARRLADAARAAGWTVRVTYASGHQVHRDGTPVESLAVRMRGADRGLVACWTDGKASGTWRIGPEISPRTGGYFVYRVTSREIAALAKEVQKVSAEGCSLIPPGRTVPPPSEGEIGCP